MLFVESNDAVTATTPVTMTADKEMTRTGAIVHGATASKTTSKSKKAPSQRSEAAQRLRDELSVRNPLTTIGRVYEHPRAKDLLIVDTRNVRAITHAKLKNDRVDARRLDELLAAGMLPGVWRCDDATRVRRRKVARRTQLVRGRTRAKNQLYAALIRQLEGRAPGRDLFSKQGRRWLAELDLPADERLTVESCLREADFLAGEIAAIDRDLTREALNDADVKRLMTIPGVDMVTAVTLMSAIGDIRRFASPRHLVGYLGLDPRVRQSGSGPARHGHISKQCSSAARHVLCEAAHSTMRAPGPLRAFGQRVRARRGTPIATVAIARKLTTLAWHMLTKEQDYLYERPALTFRKLRRLELTAGAAPRSNRGGRHGPGTPDNPPQWARERAAALAIEAGYRDHAASWRTQNPPRDAVERSPAGLRNRSFRDPDETHIEFNE